MGTETHSFNRNMDSKLQHNQQSGPVKGGRGIKYGSFYMLVNASLTASVAVLYINN